VPTEDQKIASSEALEIFNEGQTFEYIFKAWQKRHSGDSALGKALLYSIGTQSVLNSNGLHVAVIGNSGYGKSDAIRQAGALICNKYFMNGGITPQSLYYSKISDSCVIGLDDVVWNSELGVTLKRITSEFQDGAVRLSTTIDRQGTLLRTARRLVFWVSCVDHQADEQVRDRFIMYNVSASEERRLQILNHMKETDQGLEIPDDVRHETLVCQALTFYLKQNAFQVVMPFARQIKFDGDPRAYGIFRDIVKSSAVLHSQIREKDLYNRIIATIDDFEAAKSVYLDLNGHNRDKYTESETKILDAILRAGGEATQKRLQELTNLSQGRIHDIFNGRNAESHGLLYKCPQLSVDETARPKKYILDPRFSLVKNISIELT
jgi:hypothetical protein